MEEMASKIAEYTAKDIFGTTSSEYKKYVQLRGCIIVLEGPICVGKTTLGTALAAYLNSLGIEAVFFPEKVPKASKEYFYEVMAEALAAKIPNSAAFPFQMAMLLQCQKTWEEALNQSGRKHGSLGKKVVIIDRTTWGNAVFATLHKLNGNITERQWRVYLDALKDGGPYTPDYVLYLHTKAERCEFAIKNIRRDPAEAEMPLWYLEKLEAGYYYQLCHQMPKGYVSVVDNSNYLDVRYALDTILASSTRPRLEKVDILPGDDVPYSQINLEMRKFVFWTSHGRLPTSKEIDIGAA